MHNWLDTILEAYIAYILTMEYYFGRSDTDLKKEEKRKAKKRVDPPQISRPSSSEDVAVGPATQISAQQGSINQGPLEMRKVYGPSDTDFLYNPPGPESKKD